MNLKKYADIVAGMIRSRIYFLKNDIHVHPLSFFRHTTIGRGTRIQGFALLRGTRSYPCIIGKYCAIGWRLTVVTENHDMGYPNLQYGMQKKYGFRDLNISKGPVSIGNNCWIGDNVTILSGVTIGDGAAIGAASVVTKDVQPFSVNAGTPCRQLKYRFSENIIRQLQEIRWWDWQSSRIRQNKAFFDTNLVENPDIDLHTILI